MTKIRISVRAALALGAVTLAAAGCGRTVTVDAAGPPASLPPLASAEPASPAQPGDAGAQSANAGAAAQSGDAGADDVQVVDQTAGQAGKTGNGGTVVGVQVQETPPKWVQLSAVTSPPLGKAHLININQAALYRFDKDDPKTAESSCYDACAAKWPPVTIQEDGKVYLAGVDPKMVKAIRRTDGAVQLTIGGWPAYRFSGDSKPGDLNGQGVGGTWFAVGPKGQKVE